VSIHVQATFTPQGNLPFPALYSGIQSLDPAGQAVETLTVTGYFGGRLWEGAEFFLNGETFHGFGLRNPDGSKGTVGIAGFVNGDALKGGRWDFDFYVARLYVTQTLGFGGEQETIKDDLNQIAGKKDISRLTFTVGKFSINDFFDNNTYAHDPRTQFMNWSIWEAGAFDFAADVKGYTAGAFADYNQKDWAFRAGYFLVPVAPGALALAMDVQRHGAGVVELEERYKIDKQPGKLRLLGFANTVFTGDYQDALSAPNPPNIDATRRDRTKFGFVINLEQALSDNIGAFFRYSWNDDRTQLCCFTDINESFSGGVSIKGKLWDRPDDTLGLGAAFNMLSPAARRYFAAGGLGLLIGDGALSYSGEDIFETYYSFSVTKNISLIADYQYVQNPAYNLDRGPVHIFGGRIHVQF
jgi:high affinity Mn2+ porin